MLFQNYEDAPGSVTIHLVVPLLSQGPGQCSQLSPIQRQVWSEEIKRMSSVIIRDRWKTRGNVVVILCKVLRKVSHLHHQN